MYPSKSKARVFSTYSKRKQFVRVVRDQWASVKKDSFDNVFDMPQPNTSTPLHQCTIPKASPTLHVSSDTPSPPLKPINLGTSGLFDDTPLEPKMKVHGRDMTDLRRVLSISNDQNCSKAQPPSTRTTLRSSNILSNNSSHCRRNQSHNISKNSTSSSTNNANISKSSSTNNTNISKNSASTNNSSISNRSTNVSNTSQNTSEISVPVRRAVTSRVVTRSMSASLSLLDTDSIHTSRMSTDASTSLSDSDGTTDVSIDDSLHFKPSEKSHNVSKESLDSDKENISIPSPDSNTSSSNQESVHNKLYSKNLLSPILDNSQSLFGTIPDDNCTELPVVPSQSLVNYVDVSMTSVKDVSMVSLTEDVSVMSIREDNVSMKDNVSIKEDASAIVSRIEDGNNQTVNLSMVETQDVMSANQHSDIVTEEIPNHEVMNISNEVMNISNEVMNASVANDVLNTSTTRRSVLLDTDTPAFVKLKAQCTVLPCIKGLFASIKGELRKIGEGCFGEVYMDIDTVYKVVPVGGDVVINEAEQTSYDNALQEILVSKMLSELAGDDVQMGKAFCQLKDVILTRGVYPQLLLDLWDQYAESKGTENERPDMFPAGQRYVILLSKYSGVQLEDYCSAHKLTPDQAHSIVRQCCCSLAAAEKQYKFEHRDLHWGNVLIDPTSTELVEFTADGKEFILRSHGLLATIIDFTFSRLETEGCLNFVDLENEEWLFEGDQKVDIQFRVYKDMRRACRKNWAKFTPKTNVQWLGYLIDKMNIKIKSKKLRDLKGLIGNKKSAAEVLPLIMRSL